MQYTSYERVRTTLEQKEPDRVPFDLGGAMVTGININALRNLKEYLGMESGVRLWDPVTQLAVTDEETVVSDSHNGLVDVAVSPDGSSLCLAGDGVEVWRHARERWSCTWRRAGFAYRIAFAEGGDLLAVAAREPWLEIWQVAEDLPTLAVQKIPGRITCLAAAGDVIVIGLRSGEIVSLTKTLKSLKLDDKIFVSVKKLIYMAEMAGQDVDKVDKLVQTITEDGIKFE